MQVKYGLRNGELLTLLLFQPVFYLVAFQLPHHPALLAHQAYQRMGRDAAFIVGGTCQGVLDDQHGILQELQGVEYGHPAHLKLSFFSHCIVKLIHAEYARHLTNDTQHLEALGCLAYILALHVLCKPLGSQGIDVGILTH